MNKGALLMGGNKCYQKQEFIIFYCGEGYIVQNMEKEFENGHTHLKSFNAGKRAINLVIKGKIPKDAGNYFLESLARLSNDPKYQIECRELIQTRKKKGKKQSYRRYKGGYRNGK